MEEGEGEAKREREREVEAGNESRGKRERERVSRATRGEGVAGERGCGVASVPAQWPGHRVLCLVFCALFSLILFDSRPRFPREIVLFTNPGPGVCHAPCLHSSQCHLDQRLFLLSRSSDDPSALSRFSPPLLSTRIVPVQV